MSQSFLARYEICPGKIGKESNLPSNKLQTKRAGKKIKLTVSSKNNIKITTYKYLLTD